MKAPLGPVLRVLTQRHGALSGRLFACKRAAADSHKRAIESLSTFSSARCARSVPPVPA